MNATEFEIEFYAAMSVWASGGKVDPDPRGEWESATESGAKWWSSWSSGHTLDLSCGTSATNDQLCR